MEEKKEFIKTLKSITGKYSSYEIFSDWLQLNGLAIASFTTINKKTKRARIKSYEKIFNKYTQEEIEKLVIMTEYMCNALSKKFHDFLGEIYEEMGFNNEKGGQFFTPYNISLLMSKTLYNDPSEIIETQGFIDLNEPTCGSGGMIIAFAQTLYENNINYKKYLKVIAQDIDLNCVLMTYIQLSFLEIQAEVVCGNTLINPYPWADTDEINIYRTPQMIIYKK